LKTHSQRTILKWQFVVPKLLKCDWQEWPRNPRAMSLAAIACSCNSSLETNFIFWKFQSWMFECTTKVDNLQ